MKRDLVIFIAILAIAYYLWQKQQTQTQVKVEGSESGRGDSVSKFIPSWLDNFFNSDYSKLNQNATLTNPGIGG